jgi:D-amino-acid oxidase
MQPTPELSPDHSDAAETRPIVVLGAGVIGLTTAVRLLESASVRRRGIPVHILADHLPNDPLDAKYASTIAGAHHLSFADDDDLRQRTWDRTSGSAAPSVLTRSAPSAREQDPSGEQGRACCADSP